MKKTNANFINSRELKYLIPVPETCVVCLTRKKWWWKSLFYAHYAHTLEHLARGIESGLRRYLS